jgi:hypothetical protein
MVLPPFCLIVPALGITGGISSGVVNLGTDKGSSVPPGIGAANTLVTPRKRAVISALAPTTALIFKKSLRETI